MEMPILKPIPIKTKGLSRFAKIKVWLKESRKWELHEDWEYETTINGNSFTIYIEKGFVFDGASIPRPLWWLFDPMGIFMVPGLVHDYAYRNQYIKNRSEKHLVSSDQKHWDDLFEQVSVEVNDMKVCSYSAWLSLRLFGKTAWNQNRKLQKKYTGEQWKELKETWKDLEDRQII